MINRYKTLKRRYWSPLSQEQLEGNKQKAFASPSRKRVGEEEEKNNIGNCKNFCITRKCKVSMISVTAKCLLNFLFANTSSGLLAKTPIYIVYIVIYLYIYIYIYIYIYDKMSG